MDIGCAEHLSADRPVALFKLIDPDPGDPAQSFAFDGDHRLCNIFADLGFWPGVNTSLITSIVTSGIYHLLHLRRNHSGDEKTFADHGVSR